MRESSKPVARLLITVLFVPVLAVVLFVFCPRGDAYELDEPDIVSASAAILVDVETGRVLYERNADESLPPASTTKVLTVLLVLEAAERGDISLDDEITATNKILTSVASDASNITPPIEKGEIMTVRELLYCIMLGSDCAACNLVAVHVSGSIEAFVELMNERAAELGCTGCSFANTHGYPRSDHWTTARSLYLIYSEAISHEEFVEIASKNTYTIAPTNKQKKERVLTNTNRLINDNGSIYYYEYARDGKTGYAKRAKHCLASSAVQGDRTLVCIVLGSPALQTQDGKLIKSFVDSAALYEYGFNNFAYISVADTQEILCSIEVSGSDVPLGLCADRELTELLPVYARSEFEYDIELFTQLATLPIKQGEQLGTVKISYRGELLAELGLVAATSRELEPSASMDIEAFAIISSAVLLCAVLSSVAHSRKQRRKAGAR